MKLVQIGYPAFPADIDPTEAEMQAVTNVIHAALSDRLRPLLGYMVRDLRRGYGNVEARRNEWSHRDA